MNTNTTSDEGKWKCVPQHDDYYECLHHKKEVNKPISINQAYKGPEEGRGGGVGVGNISRLKATAG